GQLDLIAFEDDLGIFLDVEKVRALEGSVAGRFPSPDSRSVDRDFHRSGARIGRIENKRTVNVFKMAADVSHHHVTRAKLRRRMPRFEKPFSHNRSFQGNTICSETIYTLTPRGLNSIAKNKKPPPRQRCFRQLDDSS